MCFLQGHPVQRQWSACVHVGTRAQHQGNPTATSAVRDCPCSAVLWSFALHGSQTHQCSVGIQKSKAVLAEGRSKTETISLNAIPYLLTWFWSQHLHVGFVHHHTAVVPAVKEALSCTQPALRRVLRGGLAWHGAKHPKYLQQE